MRYNFGLPSRGSPVAGEAGGGSRCRRQSVSSDSPDCDGGFRLPSLPVL